MDENDEDEGDEDVLWDCGRDWSDRGECFDSVLSGRKSSGSVLNDRSDRWTTPNDDFFEELASPSLRVGDRLSSGSKLTLDRSMIMSSAGTSSLCLSFTSILIRRLSSSNLACRAKKGKKMSQN
jgi:hypothetical protein